MSEIRGQLSVLLEQHTYSVSNTCDLYDFNTFYCLMFLSGRDQDTRESEFACLAYTLVDAVDRTDLARQADLACHATIGGQRDIH